MRTFTSIAVVLVLGCGPSVGTTPGEGTTGTGPADDGPRPVTGAPQTTTPSTTAPSSTTSTMPTTSDSLDTTGDSGPMATSCGFLCPPDGGDADCNTWDEDCPDGDKCMPWANDGGPSWNALRCSPIDNDPNAPGEPCTVAGSPVSGVDDCELHAMCWNVDTDTLMGRCVAMCQGTPQEPGCAQPCHQCVITNGGVLTLCLPICDPVAQTCAGNEICVPVSNDLFTCMHGAADATTVGDPCVLVNECSAGQFCTDGASVPGCAAGDGCCTAFCSTAADTCPAGTHCEAWSPAADACSGGPTTGACVVD